MSRWCRLWADMPNDPKWRVIARRSGRPVSEVLAVFVHMMTNAANASERGFLEAWTDEDVAMAIDAETTHVEAIRQAMEGKTLDGARLTGWEKRQPAREDGSAERAKAWREEKKAKQNATPSSTNADERTRTHANSTERTRTHANSTERDRTTRGESESDTEDSPSPPSEVRPPATKPVSPSRGTRIVTNWTLSDAGRVYALDQGLTAAEVDREVEKFRDFWGAKAGADARKVDWGLTWRTWSRNAAERPNRTRGSSGQQTLLDMPPGGTNRLDMPAPPGRQTSVSRRMANATALQERVRAEHRSDPYPDDWPSNLPSGSY